MLLIKTFTAPDAFGGTGLFAAEAIPAGTIIWDFDPKTDILYSWDEYQALPQARRDQVSKHVYPVFRDGKWSILLSLDNDVYSNHSFTPNTGETQDHRVITLRDIAEGEEITINYHDFVPPVLPDPYEEIVCVRFLRQITEHVRSASAAE